MDTPAAAEELVDPRVERSRRVICDAALTELAEAGYGGFTIESVAARAGVGKSTIYRHWGGKLELIRDALESFNQQPPVDAHEADGPRARIERLLGHLAQVLAESTFSACVPALIDAAERDPAVRDFLHAYSARRRQALVDALRAGVQAGDFPPGLDPERASLALSGALFYRRLLTGRPYDPDQVTQLVDIVLPPERA